MGSVFIRRSPFSFTRVGAIIELMHIYIKATLALLPWLLISLWLLRFTANMPPKAKKHPNVRKSVLPMLPHETFYISDNMGGWDGYLIDHKRGEKLRSGRYRVMELGTQTIYWKTFDYTPEE